MVKWHPLISGLLAALPFTLAAPAANTYEYIVVGSGAGGAPLASRLARAGHSTLLIEAGDDQGGNINLNTSIPGFQAVVTQDPKIRWDFFVNHYQDQARAQRDPKYVYQLSNGQQYVGLNPPAGAKPLGILYPRAGTLGGCVSHNAFIWITPHKSDWDKIAKITGDASWSSSNMNKYLDKVYEWLVTMPTDPTILLNDLMLSQHLAGGAAVEGVLIDPAAGVTGLANALLNDPNSRLNPARDSSQGFSQIPLIMKNGTRDGVRDFVVDTVNKGYPLTVMPNTYVTKVTFNETGKTPIATGVEYLQGKYLYRASPLAGGQGTAGSVKASKEVILAGGTYNTVQMLKLSGIGPQDELAKFGIKVRSNLPGVGTNMQDRYEIPVNVKHPNDFQILDGCTFDAKPHDKCYYQWLNNPYVLAQRGPYATNGLAAAMAVNSDYASDSNIDLFIFGGPINFQGYFPYWGDAAVANHNYFSWYTLKAHTRNRAGTVQLRSADPLDTPIINFNYFDTGTTAGGADQLDVKAMVQAINMSRDALARYYNYPLGGTSFVEEKPGANVTSDEDLETFIKDEAWGHHACGTAAIGADGDKNAVLDSKFRVRGVHNLRVVDASVFPNIPGVFIQAPIFMISEKAADVILNG
ncbi:GMC oxidoreductase [Polychaeton citri CBS 116435]|uniref:GMC oxidoreductase n=1 Tax=Polychaeton citri CBS 116435 TaxID=1314669 RepID=A0A9P4UJI1_9PEZI|nr:GMC oxidoreductase [Polychaeton citri CBS 116435]